MLINKQNSVLCHLTVLSHEMSVRDKIKVFESFEDEPTSKDQTQQGAGKKFFFPGNKQQKKQNEPVNIVGVPQTRSKPSILSEFEANLEEVWSVRKNIHHNLNTHNTRPSNGLAAALQQPVSSSSSVPKFNQNYSRHGALGNTQQGEAPHGINPHDIGNNVTSRSRRPPLHDNNSFDVSNQAKSTRPTGFTLNEAKKKDLDTRNMEDIFTSTSKRKRTFKGGSEGPFKFSSDNSHHFTQDGGLNTRSSDHRSSYAQRMAEAHLKSSGLGQFTPKQSSYTKVEVNTDDGKSTKWRKIETDADGDEFSF